MKKDSPVTTNIMVNPYQSKPFSKFISVKLPSGYGDKTYPSQVQLHGKGMSSRKLHTASMKKGY